MARRHRTAPIATPIAIEKYMDTETTPHTLLERVNAITEAIRQRAFDLFRSRDGGSGSEMEDWLQAERDVIWMPDATVVEMDNEFQAQVMLPGVDPNDIHVSALPGAIVVQADSAHIHQGNGEGVCFCEVSEKKLFRRLELPTSIDVDRVSASMDDGVLQVIAPKASSKAHDTDTKKQLTAAA